MNATDKDHEWARQVAEEWMSDNPNYAGKAASIISRIRTEAKAETLKEAVERVRTQKWPEDGTGRYDLFNRGVEAACAAILADEPKKDTCSWHFDGDLWASECGLCWEFPERGPAENGVVFCPKCGKPVRDETKEVE